MTDAATNQMHQMQPNALVNDAAKDTFGQNHSQNHAQKQWITRSVFGLAIATLGLMALGSATRVMNAGLSCPDWPLCYGTLLPSQQMNLQVFLEWFHRLVASVIGFGIISVTAGTWWYRRSQPQDCPRWLPWSMTFALGLVVFQGVLGGLTVTELLRFDIVTAHLGTGLLFFSTLLTIGVLLVPDAIFLPGGGTTATVDGPTIQDRVRKLQRLRWVGLVAVLCIYLQSLLGGLVASRWALHQCFGVQQLCTVMNSHLIGVIPATIATIVAVVFAMRSKVLSSGLRHVIHGAGFLLLMQLLLGVATFRLHLQVEPLTVAHQMVGASLLGALVIFTVAMFRTHRLVLKQAN
ncbi:heme A synthase [Alkalinema sp. FACHB-956]|uniref:COX15/CtaA family protein n=1 Tax=Alkalinema sp. FACHB-956 TaxID=2692768 RepID=UPI001F54EDD6|nr:heme A synthase [Alkalinema sp. FACHB-956]